MKNKSRLRTSVFWVLRILTVAFVFAMSVNTLEASDVTLVERADGVESPEGGVEAAYVYLEQEVVGAPGSQITVPVYIDQNPGIMGFKISIDFDSEVMTLAKITAGDITAKGKLVDSVDGNKPGTIIWSHVEAVEGPGVLFHAIFDVHKKAPKGISKIDFSYSKEDTFNENYENVALEFDDISIKVKASDTAKENSQNDRPEKIIFIIVVLAAIILVIVIIVCIVTKKRKIKEQTYPIIPSIAETPEIIEQARFIQPPLFYGSITGIKGDYVGCTVSMKAYEEITIGKLPGNVNIIINENQMDISRKHCSIRYNEKALLYEVTDYSKNGTFLNGDKKLLTHECTMVPRETILTLGHGNQVFKLD